MKLLILAMALLLVFPVVEAINITCLSSAECVGDNLLRINDCTVNSEPFYVNETISCPDGCDAVAGRCNPPMNIDPNQFIPITNRSCYDDNTLMIESKEFTCAGSTCKWLNETRLQYCDSGCYENVNEQGAGCSPTYFTLFIYTIIFFFAFLILTAWFLGKKKRGKKW